jgi:hypothetical protein
VYEVDPLERPHCGGVIKIVSFIERILRHCGLREGPLRTLASARAPSVLKPCSAEPRELELY